MPSCKGKGVCVCEREREKASEYLPSFARPCKTYHDQLLSFSIQVCDLLYRSLVFFRARRACFLKKTQSVFYVPLHDPEFSLLVLHVRHSQVFLCRYRRPPFESRTPFWWRPGLWWRSGLHLPRNEEVPLHATVVASICSRGRRSAHGLRPCAPLVLLAMGCTRAGHEARTRTRMPELGFGWGNKAAAEQQRQLTLRPLSLRGWCPAVGS
mmetsp:Transcript_3682/g.10495  ORF Transcript_3682/g.10495 Transcript_3682/m.10495 type:complete len:210 (-) Transcript_3682:623-1252(-)